MTVDETYMQRCIDLARNGAGTVSPNPMVGSVVVHNGKIIGEGWHKQPGMPHGEVNAINSVQDHSLLKESTVYVNLEPCAHFGRTPPCSDLLVSKGVKRVVIGCTDPNVEVAGKGIAKLMSAGIEVETNILKESCEELNRKFFTYHNLKRPYITLKWAQTADGFIDKLREPNERGSFPISGKLSKVLVHKLRSENDAILVGPNTASTDNPSLNTRVHGGKSPIPLILDRKNRLSKDLNVFKNSRTMHFVSSTQRDDASVLISNKEQFLEEVIAHCYRSSIQSILVEGGKTILEAFIAASLVDEVLVLESEKTINEGQKAPEVDFAQIEEIQLGMDRIKRYRHVSDS